MPWEKTPEDRRRDQQVYGSPEYKRNRELARRRASGTCEGCHHRHARLECDHINGAHAGHALSNLQMLCKGEGSCKCHEKKTAQEGGGYRAPRTAADPDPRPRTQW